MEKILVLNGPNLDMLGVREPEVYGSQTLDTLEELVRAYASTRGLEVACYQSNSEGKLIGKIHAAQDAYDGIVYNPGAHTHYSYALRDAVASISIPVIEVHLSDVSEREPFRRKSVIAPACVAQIRGMGTDGYCRAIDLLVGEAQFLRLGEGYERFFDPKTQVIVATRARVPEKDAGGQTGESEKPVEGALQKGEEEPRNYAAAYAGAITDIDPGLASYQRQSKVRESCARLGLAAMLVRDTSNIQWVTALEGVFDEERAHALLVDESRALLHTDSRYSYAVRSQASRIGSDIIVNEDRLSHAQFASEALKQGGSVPFAGQLGIEDSITYAEFVQMVEQFQTTGLAPTTDLVLGLRAVKDAGEATRLKAAQAVTDAAFAYIVDFMKPGMTEREIQLELEEFMLHHGAEGLAFRSIVATGPNGADPHAVPGKERLEAGQCVVMDFGARAYGYCADMTRTVFLGKPEGEMARAWETLRRANETVEAALKPGVTGVQAHQLAEQVLHDGGFGGMMGHGLGHGVGLDVHELPVLNPRNDAPLVEGNVVTVEPGIYIPGKFGMRLEDFGMITADGFEVFTQSTHEMVII